MLNCYLIIFLFSGKCVSCSELRLPFGVVVSKIDIHFFAADKQCFYKMLEFKRVLIGEIENVLLNLNKRITKID
ncbi:hypothetical protein SAMN05444285_10667 [Draconibacterium orientale]|jgi:hypothetical protein|uniref:Uncharacterized protein n=1 Tax=Draconibacterium orientale TaxID=1168034 RepID=X5DEX9_9BACT|nr:hypothetical protein FH5T_01460 [Draconibacterium orientale]SET11564.1 hypothetical protein SAMN05444285_10667 [Draconibacterium orientale]